jgi:hypothetical protein
MDLRQFRWFYEQEQFKQLLKNLGKGAGGIVGGPPWGESEPPRWPNDPLEDPLKNFEWLPRTTYFLGKTGNSVGDNFVMTDLLIPVAGASTVVVSYAIYNVVDPEGGSEPTLYIDTATDPTVPRSWSSLTGGSLGLTTSRINEADAMTFSNGDANPPKQYIRWRLWNPSTLNEVQVEMSLKVTVIMP